MSLVLDGSDATVGGTALSTAKLIGQSYATKVLTEQAALTGRASSFAPPLDVRTQVWYNPDLIAAYFNVPGVIGMILYFITALLTASSIVRERERGTIEQLIVTPIRSWELVVGKILPYAILAFIDTFEDPGHRTLVVQGADPRRPGIDLRTFRLVPPLEPGDRFVRFHDCQYAAGGVHYGDGHHAAEYFSFRLFLSYRSHAKVSSICFGDRPSPLLPGHHPCTDVKGCRYTGTHGANYGAHDFCDRHHGRGSFPLPQAIGLNSPLEVIMQHRRPPLPVIILVVLLLAAGIYYGVRMLNADGDGSLSASGTIEATVVNVSPEMAGKVKEVLAGEGQAVKSGEPLLALDDSLLAAQKAVAQSAVESARSALLTTQRSYDMAQAQYDATLTAARAQEGGQRLADWAGETPGRFDQPLWYFSHAEQITTAQSQIDAARAALQQAQSDYDAVVQKLDNANFLSAEQRLSDARMSYLTGQDRPRPRPGDRWQGQPGGHRHQTVSFYSLRIQGENCHCQGFEWR